MIKIIPRLPSSVVARVPQFSLVFSIDELMLSDRPFFEVADVLSRLSEKTFFNIGETIIAYQYGQPYNNRVKPRKVQFECVDPTPNSVLGLSPGAVKKYFKIVDSTCIINSSQAIEKFILNK